MVRQLNTFQRRNYDGVICDKCNSQMAMDDVEFLKHQIKITRTCRGCRASYIERYDLHDVAEVMDETKKNGLRKSG